MSIHKDCGEPIKWARRDDDTERFRPPLEFAGEVYVIDSSGVAVFVHAYREHRCDPDKMQVWMECQRRVAELKGDADKLEELDGQAAYQLSREREREQAWERAFKRDCPRCPALKNEKCIKLLQLLRKPGEIEYTLNPHPERLEPE